MANDMIKLGGLWTSKDRNGGTFLSGKLAPGVKILIFKNQYRESENHPTHIMYLSQVETQAQQAQGGESDEFFDEEAFQRGQQSGQARRPLAPEDVPPPPARPAAQRPATHRQPAPPPDYDTSDLADPFADEEAPAPAHPARRERAPF